ncbi:TonB-dependent receptor [Sphingobacterium lumbrici]|uniref:TonB-dependent receptor n=1 Tax=Sphingobacterium lumbrici TaxID=2559600 RepID=UPI00112B48CD|nr:TonB-dependent receptor [Sphingobacterium lumbrici]
MLTITGLLTTNSGFAQSANKTFYGTVVDSTGTPLKSVSVRLTTALDTITQMTDEKGQYRFKNIKGNNLYITYSMLGYQMVSKSLFSIEASSIILLPKITLIPSSFLIKDINIVKVIPIVFKQDTTQFNFSAYKFRKGALLEEALKGLAGFQVGRDGSVYFNGKIINRIEVDSRPFFGGDVLTATRNLPADFVQNIQVIDFYGNDAQQTGMKDGDTEKIINITLKEDRKKIYFGQFTVGGGTNERYIGSFGMNKFNDGEEVSIIGSINNTNTNLFSFGSLTGGERDRSLLEIGDYSDPTDGLNNVSSMGINVSRKIGNNTNLNASYSFIRQENSTEGFSELTSTYIDNTIKRKEDYSINTIDLNHRIKFDMETKFKNRDALKVGGNLLFNKQIATNTKDTELRNYDSKNLGTYQDSTTQANPNGELEMLYSKYFNKKGRKLIGNLHLSSNDNSRKEVAREYYQAYDLSDNTPINTEFLQNQFINIKNITSSSKAEIRFVEPFFAKSLFEFSYSFDITQINAIRLVEDKLINNPSNSVNYIDSLTVDYNYFFRSNRTSLNYQFIPNNKFKLNVGFAVQPLLLQGRLPREEVEYKYENVNLIPSTNIIYRFSNEMDWQIDYKGKNNQPNFYQIIPVTDNTNSRNIVVGNPELKAEFLHRISTTFRKTTASTGRYLESNFAYNIALNKIVSDKRSIDNSTIQETTFKNTGGYYDMRWYYIFNTPLFSDDVQLDLTGNTDYYNHLSFIDDRKRTTRQLFFNQALQVRYQWSDYVESVINANYMLNNAQYDIPFRTKINAQSFLIGLGAKGYFNDHISLGMEMSQRFNDGYTSTFMNINPTIMNGFVEFTFLPNNLALIRIQGFDLFDQNKSMGFTSEYIGNDVYEARNNRLGRYFMLSLNMRLQKYPKKK